MQETKTNDQGVASDSGLTSLALLARYHGQAAEPAQMRHDLGLSIAATCEDPLLAAKRQQLRARSGPVDLKRAVDGKSSRCLVSSSYMEHSW